MKNDLIYITKQHREFITNLDTSAINYSEAEGLTSEFKKIYTINYIFKPFVTKFKLKEDFTNIVDAMKDENDVSKRTYHLSDMIKYTVIIDKAEKTFQVYISNLKNYSCESIHVRFDGNEDVWKDYITDQTYTTKEVSLTINQKLMNQLES